MRGWLLVSLLAAPSAAAVLLGQGAPAPRPAAAPQASPGIAFPLDEDEIEDRAETQLWDSSYAAVAGRSACGRDCAARQAGFLWAQDHEVENEGDCPGSGAALIGCRTYAAALERAEAAIRDSEDAGAARK